MSKISIADEEAIRKEIRNKIDDKTGPRFIRLAFHTLASYDSSLKTIFLNIHHERNVRLEEATKWLDDVWKNHKDKGLSKCDVWSLAGVIAVEVMGGPKIPWKFGRKDADPNDKHNREEPHIPGISLEPKIIRNDFGPLGLTDRDIVALCGAHTVGRSSVGKWTESNNRFTNQFYVNLEKTFNNKLAGKTLNPKENSFSQGPPDMIMLASDIALFKDLKFREIAIGYARNQNEFFNDFAEAFGKLLRRSLP